jgi:protein O-GlcNAc transferase
MGISLPSEPLAVGLRARLKTCAGNNQKLHERDGDLENHFINESDGGPAAPGWLIALDAHMRGDLAEAEKMYREQIAGDAANDPAAWANFGRLLVQSNRHQEALSCYQRAAQLPAAPAKVYFNLGNGYMRAERFPEAEAAFRQAGAIDPDLLPAWRQLARSLTRQTRMQDALQIYLKLSECLPNDHSVWLEMGNTHRALGDVTAAIDSYRTGIRCAPESWKTHVSLARALVDAGSHAPAREAYRQALLLAPDRAIVHQMMGHSRLECGDITGALDAFRATQEVPNPQADGLIDVGNVLMRLGRNEEAHDAFSRASRSDDVQVLSRLADVAFYHNLWNEAIEVLEKLVKLIPDNASAYLSLAHLQAASGRLEHALESLLKGEALRADDNELSRLRASIASKRGDADEAFALYRQLAAKEEKWSRMRSCAAMTSLYKEDMTPRQVMDFHTEMFGAWGLAAQDRAAAISGFCNSRDPNRRLRIAYMTSDLHHQHPVNIFMQPVLARHDASRVEVTVYYGGSAYDDQTRLAKRRVHRWYEVANTTNDQLQRKIAADGIDILIDLAGHSSTQRLALFARRAAPVQVSFLGYPHSTGLPEIDWLIGDAIVTPEDSGNLYSEQVMRLPHCVFCYRPEKDYPTPIFDRSGPVVFGSFNNIPKVTQGTVQLWSMVLNAVPHSRFLLKAPSLRDEMVKRRYRDMFAQHGITADRLEMRGPTGLTDMMAEYRDVDICLDPFPYNGGTTTMQALWMGAPVVTLKGGNFVQRMGASILDQIDRNQWVADDKDAYVRIAAKLAKNRKTLNKEKAGLRARMLASPLCDADAYTRDIENALRAMWSAFCKTGQ